MTQKITDVQIKLKDRCSIKTSGLRPLAPTLAVLVVPSSLYPIQPVDAVCLPAPHLGIRLLGPKALSFLLRLFRDTGLPDGGLVRLQKAFLKAARPSVSESDQLAKAWRGREDLFHWAFEYGIFQLRLFSYEGADDHTGASGHAYGPGQYGPTLT